MNFLKIKSNIKQIQSIRLKQILKIMKMKKITFSSLKYLAMQKNYRQKQGLIVNHIYQGKSMID